MLLSGLGFGLILPNINLWIIHLSPSEIRGKNIGALTTFFFLGQFLSPLLFEPIIVRSSISEIFVLAGIFLFIMSALFGILNRVISDQ